MKRISALALAFACAGHAHAADFSLAANISGAKTGDSIGVWSVDASGRAADMLAFSPVQGDKWAVVLKSPPTRPLSLAAGGEWPGMIPPLRATAPLKAQELRLFAFADVNADGKPDAGAPLREVRLREGRHNVFLAWVSGAATLKSGEVNAALNEGWNLTRVQLGQPLQLLPSSGTGLDGRVSP